jgi:hypothetical protein
VSTKFGPSPMGNLVLLSLCYSGVIAYTATSGLDESLRMVVLLICGAVCQIRYCRASC